MPVELNKALERQVMDLLSTGIGPMEVSCHIGVSKTTAYKLHQRVGGVYPPADVTYSGRYLDRDERYEMARLREAGHTIRQVAGMLGRAPSTVSRELRRNSRPGTGRYEPERADRLAWDRQRRSKGGPTNAQSPGQVPAGDGPGDRSEALPVAIPEPPRR